MIRDTFETNPGLCELFKRKILERAQSAGLSRDLIDFESQLDIKGTFKDNLEIFYREYPQLAQGSDYLRFKSPRPLTGVALEQSWRSYERSNGRAEQPAGMRVIMPELTVSSTVGLQSPLARKEAHKEPRPISRNANAVPSQAEANQTLSGHTELMKLLLDRVAAMADWYCSQCAVPLREAVKGPDHSVAALAFVAGRVHAEILSEIDRGFSP